METLGFKTIADLLKVFPDEQTCIEHLENLRWNGNVVSPFDETSIVYKCKGNKYRCKNTNKYFNVKTGTIFDNTKIPLIKWFMALYVFSSHKKGISSHQLARDINVTQKTAWFLLHRLRYAFEHPNFKKALSGEVEVDETYIGGDPHNKHESKKERYSDGKLKRKNVPVVGLIQRGGNVIANKVKNKLSFEIMPTVYENLGTPSETKVYSDEYGAYKALDRVYAHSSVKHFIGQYTNGEIHTNNIECFWSHLKRGIYGIYHWVSVKHLQSYIEEFTLRYNTRNTSTSQRFDLILCNITRRLTYQTLINK
jgi:hypothetical protein